MAATTIAAQSYGERRRVDAAALLALHGLETGEPVPHVLKLFADAGLLHTLPLVVDSHPIEQLERMVMSIGVGTARQIETALNSNRGREATPPLADDKGFQRYMALRLQLVEGSQLASEIHEADLQLRRAFTSYMSCSIQLHRLLNDSAEGQHAASIMGRLEFSVQSIATARLKESARVSLLRSSRELEEACGLVAAYSGVNMELGCIPTQSLLEDGFLDDDEEDHAALLLNADGSVLMTSAPLPPPPPGLNTAHFKVSTSSDTRSARLVVSAVRKNAAGAVKRVKEATTAMETFADAVHALSEGRSVSRHHVGSASHSDYNNSSSTPGGGNSNNNNNSSSRASGVKQHPHPSLEDDAVLTAEAGGLLVSPTAKLHFSSAVRDKYGLAVTTVESDRQEQKDYLAKRRAIREQNNILAGRAANLATTSTTTATTSTKYSSSVKAGHQHNEDDENGDDANNNDHNISINPEAASDTLATLMSVVQKMSSALSGGAIGNNYNNNNSTSSTAANTSSSSTTTNGESTSQLAGLAESLSSLSVTLASQVGAAGKLSMKALASAGPMPVDLASPPPAPRQRLKTTTARSSSTSAAGDVPPPPSLPPQQRKMSSLLTSMVSSMKSASDTNNNAANKTSGSAASVLSKGSSSAANNPVARRALSASRGIGSLVVHPRKEDSYLRKFGSIMGGSGASSSLLKRKDDEEHRGVGAGAGPEDAAAMAASMLTSDRDDSASALGGGDTGHRLLLQDGSSMAGGGMHVSLPFGQRVLTEALSLEQAGQPVVISRSESPPYALATSRSSSPSQQRELTRADKFARETKVLQRSDTLRIEAAGYAMDIRDMAVRVGKLLWVPPSQRPPTSAKFGKGEESWRTVWKDGVALVDYSLLPRHSNNDGSSGSASAVAPGSPANSGNLSNESSNQLQGFSVNNASNSNSSSNPATRSNSRERRGSSSQSLLAASISPSRATSADSRSSVARSVASSKSVKHAAREERRNSRTAAAAEAVEAKQLKRSLSREKASPVRGSGSSPSKASNAITSNNNKALPTPPLKDSHGQSLLRRSNSIERGAIAETGAELLQHALEDASRPIVPNSRSNSSRKLHASQPGPDLHASLTAALLASSSSSSSSSTSVSSFVGGVMGSPLPTVPSLPGSRVPTPSPSSANVSPTAAAAVALARSPRRIAMSKQGAKSSSSSSPAVASLPPMTFGMEYRGALGAHSKSPAFSHYHAGFTSSSGVQHHTYIAPGSTANGVGNSNNYYDQGADVSSTLLGRSHSSSNNTNSAIASIVVPVMEVHLGRELFRAAKEDNKILQHQLAIQREQAKIAASTAAQQRAAEEAIRAAEEAAAKAAQEQAMQAAAAEDEANNNADRAQAMLMHELADAGFSNSEVGFAPGLVSPRKLILNKMLQRTTAKPTPLKVNNAASTTTTNTSITPRAGGDGGAAPSTLNKATAASSARRAATLMSNSPPSLADTQILPSGISSSLAATMSTTTAAAASSSRSTRDMASSPSSPGLVMGRGSTPSRSNATTSSPSVAATKKVTATSSSSSTVTAKTGSKLKPSSTPSGKSATATMNNNSTSSRASAPKSLLKRTTASNGGTFTAVDASASDAGEVTMEGGMDIAEHIRQLAAAPLQ